MIICTYWAFCYGLSLESNLSLSSESDVSPQLGMALLYALPVCSWKYQCPRYGQSFA